MRTLPLIVLSLALLVPAGVPQARAAALTHKPRPAAAQAAPAGGSKAMAAKPAPRRGAAAAPAAGSDAPFWTGHPSAASFEKSNDQRLARVRQLVARLTGRGARIPQDEHGSQHVRHDTGPPGHRDAAAR